MGPQVLLSGAYSSPLVSSLTPATYTRPISGYTYSSYSPYVAYNPYYHPIVKRDADAEADPAVVYHAGVTGYPINSMVSPVTYTGVPTVYSGLHPAAVAPVTYTTASVPVAPVTHKITSYNNPSHYTAQSYGAFGPKYIAKNHGVEHVVKREAGAEPEADPAVVYHTGVTGYPVSTYSALNSVVSPVTYTTGSHVVAPVSYSHVVSPATYGVVSPVRGSYFSY